METKDPKSTESEGGESGAEARDPGSASTSDDTLHDLEENEKVTDMDVELAEEEFDSAPSPDGELDDQGGRPDDTGPM